MTSNQKISDAIKEDHRDVCCALSYLKWQALTHSSHSPMQIFAYHEAYKKSVGDFDAQQRWSRQLIWEVARHSIGEVRFLRAVCFQRVTLGPSAGTCRLPPLREVHGHARYPAR